ncbi:DNA-binding transcriptional regulator [Bradyrhizobium viridifuturi]|jgi:IclR family transcriptional regulator, mhp operon transcriptional activator|uniref:DNA-binding transcriptional regulator n=1 Tax=Bradyrhizobium TaxID=374 RepID=UPI00039690A0|nr:MULTISPECIES: DNA-binding transcriptional regulator [Bradyrhizobium]ERF81975.1 MAG: IclR family transcriptional regulator, mhp operon transcriptional activator [Bradyrhizobium sp. DFCI-1]MCA3796367.1 DNA-binding transcriptional regulator [Burkholderia sp.]OYU64123.1 MAG: transcriptional regulator [Bradyrhizobium sp. PARBB1]PSO25872.1 transcriptional regulator [Bradyrhizobium sp. MOS004]QRI67956.1 DNA-binding transcriptional regulator [Bradyrhizobium sp. PSBB068]
MSKERTSDGRPKASAGVRAFKRGLDVLTEVNRSGGVRAADVARALDLPRPTVYRLLETLEELGYIARSASDDRYRVTRLASSLGDGYNPSVVICQAAAPYLNELSKTLVWPVDLSTYENAAMVVQETTHSRSPMSIDRGMIGKRLPILRTSAGRAYLAASAERERNLIVNHLRRIDEADDRPFLGGDWLERMIAETRERGYGVRNEGEYNPKTASIAVPIVRDEAVFGCISIIWIRSALSLEDAVSQFVMPMRQAAAAITIDG